MKCPPCAGASCSVTKLTSFSPFSPRLRGTSPRISRRTSRPWYERVRPRYVIMETRDEIPEPMARLQPQMHETGSLTVLQFPVPLSNPHPDVVRPVVGVAVACFHRSTGEGATAPRVGGNAAVAVFQRVGTAAG